MSQLRIITGINNIKAMKMIAKEKKHYILKQLTAKEMLFCRNNVIFNNAAMNTAKLHFSFTANLRPKTSIC